MKALDRILVDKFSIKDAVTFEDLEKNKLDKSFLEKHIFTMDKVFSNLPSLKLNDRKLELFLNGVILTFRASDGVYNIYTENGHYIGLGIVKNELLKRDVII